jgi:uncharacterized protein with PIN domain
MRFILDGMLGSLSRWLRICGYDTLYKRDVQDDNLIEEADRTCRILLTKDKELVSRARKKGIPSYYVGGLTDEERLAFLTDNLNVVLKPINSRCPICNNRLNKTDKILIKDKVPKRTYKHQDEFWLCENCSKVYWKGSHWTNISRILEKLNSEKIKTLNCDYLRR